MKPRRNLYLVAVSLAFWGMGEGLFLVFQPLYIQQLGADPILIGTILGINGLVMALSGIPTGYFSDRYGRRSLMWFSWVLGVVSTLIMAFASSLSVFVVGLLLYGLTAAVIPTMNSYVAAARGSWSVGKALSFVSAFYSIGAAFAPMLGGYLAERLGLSAIYKIAAAIFFYSTFVIFFIHKQPVDAPSETPLKFELLRNQRFMLSIGMITVIIFALYLPQPLTPNFLQNVHGLNLSDIGKLGTIQNISNASFLLLLGHLPVMSAFLLAEIFMIGFALLLWLSSGMPWFMLAYGLIGGYRLAHSLSSTLIRPLVSDARVGVAFGFVHTALTIPVVLAPVLSGFIYDRRPQNVYLVSLIFLAASVCLTGLMLRYKEKLKLRFGKINSSNNTR